MTPDSLRDVAINWMTHDPEEEHVVTVRTHLDDAAWIASHFAEPLGFGTAGIRGRRGPGPARMNRALVQRVAAAIGEHLEPLHSSACVVIGYDGRIDSRTYAHDATRILAGRGHRVLLYEHVVTTPQLAHAVVWHQAHAGLMITASHNPPQDNGLKVYDHTGAQIISPTDASIRSRIDWERPTQNLLMPPMDTLRDTQRVRSPEPSSHREWLNAALAQRIASEAPRHPVRIAYSAMHGVAGSAALQILREGGHADVFVVPHQQDPDGTFPTLPNPNPQDPEALTALQQVAMEHDCTLLLANDPDGDRLAVGIRTPHPGVRMFTGDEIGVLLADDLLSHGDPHTPRCVVSSLVSTTLLDDIASHHGAHRVETLTGFKWIARAGLEARDRGEHFVLGFEESIGYCAGLHVRDKDGITAALLVADLTARLAARGETLEDALRALYVRHQHVINRQRALRFNGDGAADTMALAMAQLREQPPTQLAGQRITRTRDLLTQVVRCTQTGAKHPTLLPNSNVLEWTLTNGDRVIFRPSGTEPKLKVYVERRRTWQTNGEPLQQQLQAEEEAEALLDEAMQHVQRATEHSV